MRSSTLSLRRLLLLLAIGFALLHPAHAAEPDDKAIIAEMKGRMAAIQKKMAATDDLNEKFRLQDEGRKILDDALARVSEKSRPMLEISIKILGRFFDSTRSYAESTHRFFNGPGTAYSGLKSREEIAARVKEIDAMSTANAELARQIDGMEAEISAALDRTNMSKNEKLAFLAGYRGSTGRKMSPLRALRTLDGKLLVQWKALYTLLDAEWGHWHADENNILTWESPEASAKHQTIAAELQHLSELSAKAQQAFNERT